MWYQKFIGIQIILLLTVMFSYAQSPDDLYLDDFEFDNYSDSVLLLKEVTGGFFLHSAGWGLEFRKGKNVNAFKKRMFEVDFTEMKSPKEIRVINPYFSNAKSYIFGKLNNIYLLRAGIGQHHLITSKPYWGGVELRFLYSGGLSLGFAKPVYLNIINLVSISNYYYEYELSTEKYNPDEHFRDNIYGRAAFVKGIEEIGLYPGAYVKAGFNFDFGTYNAMVKALEFGAAVDIFPRPVPVMAFNDPEYYFLTFYLSINFGKRYN